MLGNNLKVHGLFGQLYESIVLPYEYLCFSKVQRPKLKASLVDNQRLGRLVGDD
jgi:hypothetical protein